MIMILFLDVSSMDEFMVRWWYNVVDVIMMVQRYISLVTW